MITSTSVRLMATKLSGFNDIPVLNVIMYMTDAAFDLATRFDTAGVKEITYLYGIDEDWTDLPETCIAVKRVFKDNQPYDDFVIENGKIKFAQTGEYKAELITAPYNPPLDVDVITGPTLTLKINPLYLYAICYYVAYRETASIFMHEDIVAGNNKSMLLLEYNKRAEEANRKLRGMKKSRSRMKYPDFM